MRLAATLAALLLAAGCASLVPVFGEADEPSALSYAPPEVVEAELRRRVANQAVWSARVSALLSGERVPGVGLPGVPVGFDRYDFPQRTWKGHYAELIQNTRDALTAACRGGLWGTAETHTCVATQPEEDYAVVYFDRHGDFFRRWLHEQRLGGTPERPEIVSPSSWWGQNDPAGARAQVERYGGTWKRGLIAYPTFWGSPRWTAYFLNELPCSHPVNADLAECGSVEPPPVTCPDGTCTPEEFDRGSCPADCEREPPPPTDECEPAGRVGAGAGGTISLADGGTIHVPDAGLLPAEWQALGGVRAGNRVGGPGAESILRRLTRCGVLVPGTRAELYARAAEPGDVMDACAEPPPAPTLWEITPTLASTGRLSMYLRRERCRGDESAPAALIEPVAADLCNETCEWDDPIRCPSDCETTEPAGECERFCGQMTPPYSNHFCASCPCPPGLKPGDGRSPWCDPATKAECDGVCRWDDLGGPCEGDCPCAAAQAVAGEAQAAAAEACWVVEATR